MLWGIPVFCRCICARNTLHGSVPKTGPWPSGPRWLPNQKPPSHHHHCGHSALGRPWTDSLTQKLWRPWTLASAHLVWFLLFLSSLRFVSELVSACFPPGEALAESREAGTPGSSGRRARVWLGLGKRTSGLGTLTPAVFQLRELVHITPPELGSLHGEPAHHLCPDSMPGPHSEGSSQAGVLLPWVFLWLRSGGCGGWRLGWALGRCL